MGPQPVGQLLLSAANNGRIELLLSVMIIAVSLASPAATAPAVTIEVLAVFLIPLLQVRGGWASVPLVLAMGLIAAEFANHLLLSGLIVYLAVQYAIARGRNLLAAVIALQWMVLAYVIVPVDGFLITDALSIIFELVLFGIAAGVGYFRCQSSAQMRHRDLRRQQVEESFRHGLPLYLHDHLVKSLETIALESATIRQKSTDPATRQSLHMITNAGDSALRALRELMDELSDIDFTTPSTTGIWQVASIGETVSAAVHLLQTAGFDVECDPIDRSLRTDAVAGAAFTLAFEEIMLDLLTHAPPGSNISVTVTEDEHQCLIKVVNHRMVENPCMGEGDGLEKRWGVLRTRMNDVGGDLFITSTASTWQMRMGIPLHNAVKEN